MNTFVWVDAWQQQCCGEPFAVGSTVNWTVAPHPDVDRLTGLLGDAWATRVQYQEEHHTGGADIPALTGEVVSIHVVTTRRVAHKEGKGKVLTLVPGSAALREVQLADPWEPEPPRKRRKKQAFDGWIVALDAPPPTTQGL